MAKNDRQECIPVGCVPAARRSYAGVCFPGGVCSGGGVWSGGVCGPGGSGPGVCVCLVWGRGGWYPSMH